MKPQDDPRLHGKRYFRENRADAQHLAKFILDELHYLDYAETLKWYARFGPALETKENQPERALLGCNDRYFLLTSIMNRRDALHPWLFNRCREIESDPDGYLDLWARFHYKSTFGTLAGILQEVARDPEITVCILSATNKIAQPFLFQLQNVMETNQGLKDTYPDVFWQNPRREAPKWSRNDGLIVQRKSNPKESTIEAWGLVDGMPTGKHYRLLDYDDLVTEKLAKNPDIIKKVTECWELSDSLGTAGETRKWHFGTRYSFGDSYGILLERKTLKQRLHPATDDGTLDGNPVFLKPKRWAEIKDAQRSTVNAQFLQNPLAGNEQLFKPEWFKTYDVRPTLLNVYIMVDPSKGRTNRSDRTAMAVVGVDVAGNRYLLDGIRHRMQLTERWAHLRRLYQKWSQAIGVQLTVVGYERYGAQTEDEVIKEWQQRDGVSFELIELSWPREGMHSKPDRVGRLEPDFRKGRFYLPAVVHHPIFLDPKTKRPINGGLCFWGPWTQEMHDAAIKNGEQPKHNVGQIVYRPYLGPTKRQLTCEKTNQGYRIATPIKAFDEDRKVYDVTRCLIEEMSFFPFSPKDDLVDATSRLYDLEPRPAVQHESEHAEARVYADT